MTQGIEEQYADEISEKLKTHKATMFEMADIHASARAIALAVRARGHISIVLGSGDVYSAIKRHNIG